MLGSRMSFLPTMTFLPCDKRVSIKPGQTVLDVALSNGVELDHSCGGMGSCTTCRVFVESPLENLSERTDLERERAEERGFLENERLACQLEAMDEMVVRID